ncbi:hypothetical protein COB52_00595 [Candidatus Kaiserbacteria bacterium]|nr:MAG: hypothetical protein COB52_00595 [Candidatus Kaiserbacteria bacterium]
MIYVIFIIYSVFTIIIHKKTEYRTNPEGDVKAIFWAFTKTIEKDIAPSLLVFGLAISLGTFHFFMMLLGMTLIAAIVILTLGYLKSAANLIRVGKFINVTVTILAFLNSFIDSME